MLSILERFVFFLNNYILWGIPMIFLLFGTHLFLTFQTGFIQRKLGTAILLSLKKDSQSKGEISQFGALATSLASTLGTGNIIGLGTAIFLGGPGAVFWCWISGIFGIATKYAESLIAVKYRVQTRKGEVLGGAMYILDYVLHKKKLAILFSIFPCIASLGIGCGIQANAIFVVAGDSLPFSPFILRVLLVVATAFVILGGVKTISNVCEKLVPMMTAFYMICCIIILIMNYDYLWQTIIVICKFAFTPGAAAGGLIGSGIRFAARFGIARGLFSNEAGMGSSPIISAAAQSKNPVRQSLVASTAVFWDTVVICLITGLVLVSSTLRNPNIDVSSLSNGGELAPLAFAQIPIIGPLVLFFGILTFAYSTILGWSYYGECCLRYLFGNKMKSIYRFLYSAVLFYAPVINTNLLWALSDSFNALMAIPNLIAVLTLSKTISKDTSYYLAHLEEEDNSELPIID